MKKAANPSGTKPKPANQSSAQKVKDDINLWHDPFVHIVIIIAVGFIIYINTVTSPFLFDDYPYLVKNPVVKDFSFYTDTDRILNLGVNVDVKNNFILRPVSYFTFALNYALHGLDVRGYHVANLNIHIGCALLVYFLLYLVLRTPVVTGDIPEKSASPAATLRYLPLFCALLFVCHPLQTQAVTYIIQRFTSLVALFYLGSLVLYVKGRLAATTTARISCFVASVVVALLAMKTKENAFTLPVMITLFEFMFFNGSVGKRVVRLIPLLLTLIIIPLNLMKLSSLANPDETDAIIDTINLVNFRGVSPWDYLMTQFGVITTYMRLLILPIGQNFDYDYVLQKNFFSFTVLLPLGLLLLILGTAIYLLVRSRDNRLPDRYLYRIIAFGIFWFFITLSVESSIIPIDDLIFEHRAYLPAMGFFMAMLAGITSVYRRSTGKSLYESGAALWMLSLTIVCLSAASIARNAIWADKVTFWNDVAKKSPKKPRVHTLYGNALLEQGKTDAGIEEIRAAIKLKPNRTNARINLGKALLMQKRYDDAIAELQAAVRLNAKDPLPYIYLGLAHEGKEQLLSAEEIYLDVVMLSPSYPDAHLRLGELYVKENRIPDAIKEFETVLKFYPDEEIRKRMDDLKRMVVKP